MRDPALLLKSKLLPPALGPYHLVRERLHQRLRDSLDKRVSVVLGGPGYGKTSLVAGFLQGQEAEWSWYRLDPVDRDPWIFFRYLTQAIRRHEPGFGDRSAGLAEGLRAHPEEIERLADVLVEDAEDLLAGRLILVLDGIEALEGSDLCERVLRRLLAYLPDTLHVVLAGRSIPELGIAALAAKGAASVIPSEELLFTAQETQLMLEQLGLKLGDDVVQRVQARTRGWVTALRLLSQTAHLRQGVDLSAMPFEKTEEEIFAYFSEEALASEPVASREFLLCTSVLPIVDPDLVREVLPDLDVQGILRRLLQRNLFLSPLEGRMELYSYDPLFRDFLYSRLRRERSMQEVRRLQRAYGSALARREDHAQALAHLLAGEDAAAAAELLGRHGRELLHAGMIEAVREAAAFAVQHGEQLAAMHDLLGEACRLLGDYAAAAGHFEHALVEPLPEAPALQGPARGRALGGLAYSLLKIGELARAAAVAEDGLRQVGDDNPVLKARLLNTLSIVHYQQNRQESAIAGWHRALALARRGGDGHLTRMIAHNLGLPYAVMGDFRRAEECFRLLTDPENPHLGPEEGAAYLNLARIAVLRGDHAAATRLLDDALEIARKWKLEALTGDVLEAQANLLRESGRPDAAAEKYAAARSRFTSLGLVDVLDNLAEEEAILAASRGWTEPAVRLGSEVLERARASGQAERIASALLALGEIECRRGNSSGAQSLLTEAVSLYGTLGRAFQECTAGLWLALARWRKGDAAGAAEAAERALRLASSFDYLEVVGKVAALDAGFRGALKAMPLARAFARQLQDDRTQPGTAAQEAETAPSFDLMIRLLGAPEVYRDAGRRIPARAWKLRRALSIFCYLAAARSHRASKDRVAYEVWGDARPSVIRKNFHPTISFLRRALNDGHHVPRNFILYEGGAYLLNPDYRYDIDTESFEKGVRSARRKAAEGRESEALGEYAASIALYRGPFLEDEDAEWTEAPRSHFEGLHLAALAEAGELELRKGDPERGLHYLNLLVARSPLDEGASIRLMNALAGRGRKAAIEKEFPRLEKAIGDTFSAAPRRETRQAYEAALGKPG